MSVGKTVPFLLKVVMMIHGVLRCSAQNAASSWPDGCYGIPKSLTGCPSGWEDGYRYHDTEDRNPNNQWSSPLHLAGTRSSSNMRHEFCMKIVADFPGPSGGDWPRGAYCIYRRGGSCPSGFATNQNTYIYWDDEDNSNGNSVGGHVPDGIYDRNTRIQFCCRNDGYTWRGISLPTDHSFFLLARYSRCQEVNGMRVYSQWLRWDTEDSGNADSQSWVHPYEGIQSGGANVRLTFCYYTPN